MYVELVQNPEMSGWPSTVFGGTYARAGGPFGFAAAAGACAPAGTSPRGDTAISVARTPSEMSDRRAMMKSPLPAIMNRPLSPAVQVVMTPALLGARLAEMAVDRVLRKLDAAIFDELRVALHAPVERHAHLPGLREHLGIVKRDLVQQRVGAARRDALDRV